MDPLYTCLILVYITYSSAVTTGLEPATSCVVDDARFELARGVLNIHLTFTSVPTIHYSAIIKRFLKWFTPLYRQAF